jgi:antitoxin component YwqK of YwqJK toxin-antitoxin module
VTATQGPDGTIHIATSKNTVNYEIELNEAWVLNEASGDMAVVEGSKASEITEHRESWPNGKLKAVWSTQRTTDGRILLEGAQTFYNEAGGKEWTATFDHGNKIGDEFLYRADGSRVWQKTYAADGNWTWRTFDDAGKLTATSHWRKKTLIDADFSDGK